MAGGLPADRLRRETLERIDDGWDVLERDAQRVVLGHRVDPPWWRVLLELPFALVGSVAVPVVSVRLTVWIDDGRLWRRTEGDLPRGWRRRFAWWVPDGPVDTR